MSLSENVGFRQYKGGHTWSHVSLYDLVGSQLQDSQRPDGNGFQ